MSINSASWTRIAIVAMMTSMAACTAESSTESSVEDDLIDQADAIIGGVPATNFPESALLSLKKNGRAFGACSGTVIAPRVVLTAGHCVNGATQWDVTAPFANNQRASSSKGALLDYQFVDPNQETVDPNRHDVGLVILDTPINLTTFPTLATSKVADGTQVVNIGRIQDGRLSNTQLFVSSAIPVRDAARQGFPFDYIAVETIQSGDSGGPDMLAGTHTIVAVNSGAGGGSEVLARIDLPEVAQFITATVNANGGFANGAAAPPAGTPPAASAETEVNNTPEAANRLSGTLNGNLAGGDQDWFTFTLQGGQPFNVKLAPTADAQIVVFEILNGQVTRTAATKDVRGTAEAGATYFAAAFTRTGTQQSYTLTLQ
jgi:hypothetical protein